MSLEPIEAFLARRCQAQDVRALLGKGGGHQVIAFGNPELWKTNLGITVKEEQAGGTQLPIEPEPAGHGAFELEAYWHAGRGEVRVKVGTILGSDGQVAEQVKHVATKIDPDASSRDDEYVVFIVRSPDGRVHFRGQLASALKLPISSWLGGSNTTYGRRFTGTPLDETERMVWRTLMRHKSVLLFGPPGTGKTRMMVRLRNAFRDGIAEIGFDPADMAEPLKVIEVTSGLPKNRETEFVTFHQSMTYESFVVGLRPDPKPLKGLPRFVPTDGVLLRLAEYALRDDAAALLLVDELNRGNVADIFGELITLLEPDKRLGPNHVEKPETVAVTLPLEPENPAKNARLSRRFTMPYHFYLLAAMNSLDRSVAPLDSAMRRRFRVIHLPPRMDVAGQELLAGRAPTTELFDPANPSEFEARSMAIAIVERLNEGIRRHWGPEFLLGHSYILGVRDADTLIEVCRESILPQVFELYRDRPRDLAELLDQDTAGEANSIAWRVPDADEVLIGLSQGPPLEQRDLSGMSRAEAMRRLYFLAQGKPWAPPESPPGGP